MVVMERLEMEKLVLARSEMEKLGIALQWVQTVPSLSC